jgi:hypothetical protein
MLRAHRSGLQLVPREAVYFDAWTFSFKIRLGGYAGRMLLYMGFIGCGPGESCLPVVRAQEAAQIQGHGAEYATPACQ